MTGTRLFLAVFDRLASRSDELFVEMAYRVLLGRPVDSGALANCVARLRRGENRILLVQDLVESEEFRQKCVAAGRETDRKEYQVFGVRLVLEDVKGYPMREIVVGELLQDAYGLERIVFRPGDVVVDVGGNIGIVAAYLGRKHPQLRIVTLEPVQDNFELLLGNLALNGVTNVTAVPKAVTADGRRLELVACRDFLGGASAHFASARSGQVRYTAESVTLDEVFEQHGIERCRLLKIDCEGSEHEILRAARCLGRVDHLAGEFHINATLRAQGYSIEGLLEHCGRFVDPARIHVTTAEMSE